MDGRRNFELLVFPRCFSDFSLSSVSAGDIYPGINITSGEEVAIKLESVKAKHPQRCQRSFR